MQQYGFAYRSYRVEVEKTVEEVVLEFYTFQRRYSLGLDCPSKQQSAFADCRSGPVHNRHSFAIKINMGTNR